MNDLSILLSRKGFLTLEDCSYEWARNLNKFVFPENQTCPFLTLPPAFPPPICLSIILHSYTIIQLSVLAFRFLVSWNSQKLKTRMTLFDKETWLVRSKKTNCLFFFHRDPNRKFVFILEETIHFSCLLFLSFPKKLTAKTARKVCVFMMILST